MSIAGIIALPPTGTGTAPRFSDPQSCQAWIKCLPLLNTALAQAQLLEQLRLLNGFTFAGATRFTLLESLQVPVRLVQSESAKLFAGKPLPLAAQEQKASDATHALWQELLMGYLRCHESLLADSESMPTRNAMIFQRALAILADDFSDLVRSGRLPPTSIWRLAHALYAGSEAFGVARLPVADPLRETQTRENAADTLIGHRPASPAMTYVELVLLAAASLHEFVPRHQGWIMNWARRWAAKVGVLAAPPEMTASLPLCVDLAGEAPPGFMPPSGPGARWLDTAELRRSMKKRLVLLARGEPGVTPESLGLGEDCTMPSGGEVLRRIYPRWVKGGVHRRYQRHPLSGTCRFVAGINAVHYYVAGHQSFRPPGSTTEDELRRQREELAMFGRVATRFEEQYSHDQGFRLESWTLVEDWGLYDRSEEGVCLVRPIDHDGGRLGIGQLVALQPAMSSHMQLGVLRWTQLRGELLVAGIQLLPGRPQPVAVRRTGVRATPDSYQRGFILPEQAEYGLSSALILPPGSFKPGRIMESWTPISTCRFKLDRILERGADFERATCVEII